MQVMALFIKPRAGGALHRVARVLAVAGQGLVDDCAAHPASPRHVLLVSRVTLAELALPDEALGANVILDGTLPAPGELIAVGTARLHVTIPCEPCYKLDRVRPGLAKSIGARRGVLARVRGDGEIVVGDRATRVGYEPPPPADWRARVLAIVAALPPDVTITYADLAIAAGVQPVYCRAFPALLRARASEAAQRQVRRAT